MSESADTDFKLDFGAGNVVVLLSRCLRLAKEPTDCDLCAQACPAQAITPKEIVQAPADATEDVLAKPDVGTALEKKKGVEISEDCIHCGICTAACPVESLSTTHHSTTGFVKQVSDKVAKLEGLALGCPRALYGVAPRLASRAVTVPCLAALSAEMWFYAATMARDALFHGSAGDDAGPDEQGPVDTLKVYLPPLICSDCPVNSCEDAEALYMATISKIEAWGVDNIELISEPEMLDPQRSTRLMSTLGDATTGGKRETVEHLASSFMRSWQNAGNDLTLEQKRKEHLAEKRKQHLKRQVPDQNTPRPFGKKSQNRRLLRLAFDQHKELADGVELLCTDTVAVLCTGCGACIDACPLDARRKITSNSVLYFSKLPEKERPQGEMAAVSDKLCCLGCSACVLQCPTGACVLADLSGAEFFRLRQT